jgi:glycosyltransferase involved in cell wall biosynthesis
VDFTIGPISADAAWDGVIEKDSMWCHPQEGSYKMKLRQVRNNYNRWKKKADTLQKWVLENFEEKAMYNMLITAALGEPPAKIHVDELPKISIITSIYDGDEFIKPFLEDITSQTIFEEKCELILINANSPGNEEETINEYVKMYPDNIVYKKLDKDPGIYGVWNIAAKMATGEYLTNANLDDRKAPNSLERHAKELYANPDIDLAYADMLITDEPNETFAENNSNNRKYNFPDFSLDNLKMVNMPHASPMWRKSYHEKYGYFDEKFRSAGDWEMWLRGASQGSVFKKIHEVLGLYYFNPEGISTNPENFSWKREEEKEVFQKYQ